MLRNAHERERKLANEFNDFKEVAKSDAENILELDKERQYLQLKYDVVKDKFEKSLRENQELFLLKETNIKNMEKEIFDLRQTKENKANNYALFDFEGKLQEKNDYIESLEIEEKNVKTGKRRLD